MTFIRDLISRANGDVSLSPEELAPFSPRAEEKKLVGVNVVGMAEKLEVGVQSANDKLTKIDEEISRLQEERRKTVLSIEAGEAALAVLKPKSEPIIHKHKNIAQPVEPMQMPEV